MMREYDEMKEEIKNPKNVVEYTIQKQWRCIVSIVGNKNYCVRRTRQNRSILVLNCAILSVCGKKKSRFIKNQEVDY